MPFCTWLSPLCTPAACSAGWLFIYFVSSHRSGGEGNETPWPTRKCFPRVSGENPGPRAAPEVTITLTLRWPVYQSEMSISVRCQGNTHGRRLGRQAGAGQVGSGRAGPGRAFLPRSAAQRPWRLEDSDKRSTGKCQLSMEGSSRLSDGALQPPPLSMSLPTAIQEEAGGAFV